MAGRVKEIVFVVATPERKLRKMDRDDPRLDWKWPRSPAGMVRLMKRGKDKWGYAHHGPTAEDAVRNFNRKNGADR